MMERDVKGLPTKADERKALPIGTGVLDYFPLALAAVAQCSHVGNEQHNPGKPLHWDRAKSTDEADALIRHFLERGTVDSDGVLHSAKMAWRALALLQKEIELASLQKESLVPLDLGAVGEHTGPAAALSADVVPVLSTEGVASGFLSGRQFGISYFGDPARQGIDPRD
jgi:hypothetical protein